MYTTDAAGSRLSAAPINALRYDGQSDDHDEVAGIMHVLIPGDRRVLDVGCGTGSVTLIANRDKHNDVSAIEPDETRSALARSRGLEVFNGYLSLDYIAEHGRFDVVMSSDVIEHMVDPASAIDLFVAALKPDGLLVLSVPNVAHWSVRANLLRGRFDYTEAGIMDATHLRWFTKKSLEAMLRQCGLDVVATRFTAGFDIKAYRHPALRRLPENMRRALIRACLRLRPSLFGVQIVVAARPHPPYPSS